MRQYDGWSVRLVRQVVRRRWWVMLAAGLVITALRAATALAYGAGVGAGASGYWVVTAGAGVCLPVAGGLLLGLVGRAMLEDRSIAVQRERRRLTRDLHDNLGQHVAYLRLRLDTLASGDPGRVTAQDLAQMRRAANDAYREVRTLLQQLDLQNDKDIAAALTDHANAIAQRTGLKIDVTTEGQPRLLDEQTRMQILCIFREALANVERHADATQVRLRLTWGADTLTILLQDNGRGFAPGTSAPTGHLGLGIMRERAEEIGALLTVASYPGNGTLVLFRKSEPGGLGRRLSVQRPVRALRTGA